MKATELIIELAGAIAKNGDDALVFVSTDDGKKIRITDIKVSLEDVANGGKVVTIR